MIGVFIIEKFIDGKRVGAKSKLAPDVHGVFYLPPLNRQNTSDLTVSDEFFGVMDDVSGIGALLCALDHDFEGRFDYDLTVRAGVKATGDVQAGAVSLKNHVHTITGLVVSAGEPPVPIGTGAGTTDVPVGG